MLLDFREFSENGHREGHTFIVTVNEITFMCILSSFPALLTWVWEHCILIIAAVMVIASMGMLPLTFQNRHIVFTVSSLRNNYSGNIVGQDQEF